MDKDSNKFTFLFSAIMVVVVAVLLSVAAISLAPFQQKNIRIEKMENILSTVGITAEHAEAEKRFNEHIIEQVILDVKGQPYSGSVKAFDIDLKKELEKAKSADATTQLFPLFVGKKQADTFYIIPVRGKGLWGPIWGYVALTGDMNTIYGVSFGHEKETPGLGAEINTPAFAEQFAGKKLFDDKGNYVSVKVIKGGAAPANPHAVDAVSGATITSDGVSEMLNRTFTSYLPYFKAKRTQGKQLEN